MPNGGSDCCSTCWFNKRNKGEAFCENPDDLLPDFCNIRALPIEDPVYTYCANHPRRRPEHDRIPIGLDVDEVVVWQLGEFREMKAIPQLQRLALFNPDASETGPFGRTRRILVSLAEEALAKIQQ